MLYSFKTLLTRSQNATSFLRSILSPIVSLAILVMGNGLLLTIIPLRMRLEGFSTDLVGYLTAAYYAGLILGAMQINRLIEGVGHIRAFSAFASFFTVLTMLQGLFVNPVVWLICRFFLGLCIAGVFITIESWLLVRSTLKTRGIALSIYMTTNYAAQSVGQLFLNYTGIQTILPFCFIVILSSLAVVPLALTRTRAPIIEEPSILSPLKLLKISPLGVIGSMLSGFNLGAIFGLLPVYAQDLNYSTSEISYIMGLTIFGGLIFQWPIGAISDRIDRRKVLFFISILTIITAVIIGRFTIPTFSSFLTLCVIFGGFSFVLYPLSVSHACDLVESKDLVAATGGLLLSYGIGAVIGPIVAAYPMRHLGPHGLFYYFAIVSLILALFTFYRILKKTPTSLEDKLPYSNVTRTTPMASELDPRIESSEERDEHKHAHVTKEDHDSY